MAVGCSEQGHNNSTLRDSPGPIALTATEAAASRPPLARCATSSALTDVVDRLRTVERMIGLPRKSIPTTVGPISRGPSETGSRTASNGVSVAVVTRKSSRAASRLVSAAMMASRTARRRSMRSAAMEMSRGGATRRLRLGFTASAALRTVAANMPIMSPLSRVDINWETARQGLDTTRRRMYYILVLNH